MHINQNDTLTAQAIQLAKDSTSLVALTLFIQHTIDPTYVYIYETHSRWWSKTIDLYIEIITQFQQDSLQSKVLNHTQIQSDNASENHSPSNKTASLHKLRCILFILDQAMILILSQLFAFTNQLSFHQRFDIDKVMV